MCFLKTGQTKSVQTKDKMTLVQGGCKRQALEVGSGIGMGNTCKPMAVSFQCMTKSTKKIKNKDLLPKKKKKMTLVRVYRWGSPWGGEYRSILLLCGHWRVWAGHWDAPGPPCWGLSPGPDALTTSATSKTEKLLDNVFAPWVSTLGPWTSFPGGMVHRDVLSQWQAHPIKKNMTQVKQSSSLHPCSILSLWLFLCSSGTRLI